MWDSLFSRRVFFWGTSGTLTCTPVSLPIEENGVTGSYIDIGDCEWGCEYCRATFWYGERVKRDNNSVRPQYHRCCGGGKVVCKWPRELPVGGSSQLDPEFVSTLIRLLDKHNELVRLFRTARNKVESGDVLEFCNRFFSVVGAREYDLPTSGTLGEIVFENGPNTRTNYDVIIESRVGFPQRVNKLHPSYMSLQFPLLFVYGWEFVSVGREGGFQELTPAVRSKHHCSDIVLFLTEVQDFCKFLKDRQLFGSVTGHPDTDPKGYRVVSEMMVHDGYVHYRRRETHICTTRRGVDLDNAYIVPYNRQLCLAFHAYINVESIMVGNPPADTNNGSIQIDKIHNYIDGRFVCPHEACWRILKYDIHGRQPAVQILSVHLKGLIGRLANVHPMSDELFFLRMLLYHQKGCKTFNDIPTVNKRLYPTFRAACEALGLFGDDKELWKAFWRRMSDNVPRTISNSLHIQDLYMNDPKLEGSVLYEVEVILKNYSKTVADVGLPPLSKKLRDALKNRELMEEKSYNRAELAREIGISVPKLNSDQKAIYDMVLRAANENKQEMIFVYGHGGTGKTFLWRTLINTMRSEGKIVLTVASSRIASLLLPAGRTAHSRFKLPLDLTDESLCNIKKNTNVASLLVETILIIWDESPMNDIRCFEALDMTLRDVLDDPEKLFGGKTIIVGGDFHQTLSVKKEASKSEIVCASIAASELWPHFKVCKLTENMRLLQPGLNEYERTRATNFDSWLLEIGDGKIGTIKENSKGDSSWITVPEELSDLQQKAIMCPKNTNADEINETVLEMLHGKSMVYTSSDEAIPVGSDRGEVELLYPPEYLNTLQFLGFPSHRLELKEFPRDPIYPILLVTLLHAPPPPPAASPPQPTITPPPSSSSSSSSYHHQYHHHSRHTFPPLYFGCYPTPPIITTTAPSPPPSSPSYSSPPPPLLRTTAASHGCYAATTTAAMAFPAVAPAARRPLGADWPPPPR
ncbi:DNA helicase [Tanacetum coccineum]